MSVKIVMVAAPIVASIDLAVIAVDVLLDISFNLTIMIVKVNSYSMHCVKYHRHSNFGTIRCLVVTCSPTSAYSSTSALVVNNKVSLAITESIL